jgi:hypothetical protein
MTTKPKTRKAATFVEKVFRGLLERLAELEAQEKAGAHVEEQIAVVQLLLRQDLIWPRNARRTLSDFDRPGERMTTKPKTRKAPAADTGINPKLLAIAAKLDAQYARVTPCTQKMTAHTRQTALEKKFTSGFRI